MAVKPPRARPGSASTSSLSQADTTQQTPVSFRMAARTPSPHLQERVPSPGSVSSSMSSAAIPAPEFPPHLNATQMDNMLFKVAFDAVSHPAMHSPESALKKGGRSSNSEQHAHSNLHLQRRRNQSPSEYLPARPESPCELCDGVSHQDAARKLPVSSPEPWQVPSKGETSEEDDRVHPVLGHGERSQNKGRSQRSGPSVQLSRRDSGPDHSRRSKSSGGEMQRVNLFDGSGDSSSNSDNNAQRDNRHGDRRSGSINPQERRGFRWAWTERDAREQRSKSPANLVAAFASDFEPSSKPERGRSQGHLDLSHRSPKPLSKPEPGSRTSRSPRESAVRVNSEVDSDRIMVQVTVPVAVSYTHLRAHETEADL
eukprot:3937322-Rhodomonas_salina.3